MKYVITIEYDSKTGEYSIDFASNSKEEANFEYYNRLLGYMKKIVKNFEKGLDKLIEKSKN